MSDYQRKRDRSGELSQSGLQVILLQLGNFLTYVRKKDVMTMNRVFHNVTYVQGAPCSSLNLVFRQKLHHDYIFEIQYGISLILVMTSKSFLHPNIMNQIWLHFCESKDSKNFNTNILILALLGFISYFGIFQQLRWLWFLNILTGPLKTFSLAIISCPLHSTNFTVNFIKYV